MFSTCLKIRMIGWMILFVFLCASNEKWEAISNLLIYSIIKGQFLLVLVVYRLFCEWSINLTVLVYSIMILKSIILTK